MHAQRIRLHLAGGASVGGGGEARSTDPRAEQTGTGTGRDGGRAGRERQDGARWGGEGRVSIGRDARPGNGTPPCPSRTAQPLTSREPVTDVLYTFRALMLRPRPLPAHSPGGGRSEGGAGRHRPACDCSDQWSRRARACGAATSRARPGARSLGAPDRFAPPRGTALHEWSRAALLYTQNIRYKQAGKTDADINTPVLDSMEENDARLNANRRNTNCTTSRGEARGPAPCAKKGPTFPAQLGLR